MERNVAYLLSKRAAVRQLSQQEATGIDGNGEDPEYYEVMDGASRVIFTNSDSDHEYENHHCPKELQH